MSPTVPGGVQCVYASLPYPECVPWWILPYVPGYTMVDASLCTRVYHGGYTPFLPMYTLYHPGYTTILPPSMLASVAVNAGLPVGGEESSGLKEEDSPG